MAYNYLAKADTVAGIGYSHLADTADTDYNFLVMAVADIEDTDYSSLVKAVAGIADTDYNSLAMVVEDIVPVITDNYPGIDFDSLDLSELVGFYRHIQLFLFPEDSYKFPTRDRKQFHPRIEIGRQLM